MTEWRVKIALQSDATFATGEGVPALLDVDIDHDDDGFPIVRGKRLAGLLADEGREMLTALSDTAASRWTAAHDRVFGRPGSGLDGQGGVAFGTAQLPRDIRYHLLLPSPQGQGVRRRRQEVLNACSYVRRQMALDRQTRAPEPGLLRASRVALRGLYFMSPVDSTLDADDEDGRAWLAASVRLLRRGGIRRNRGRGRLHCSLHERAGVSWSDRTEVWCGPLLRHLRGDAS